jgi:hypothetical protein
MSCKRTFKVFSGSHVAQHIDEEKVIFIVINNQQLETVVDGNFDQS